ncbi:hypothetical protein SLA2020_078560 [Shorea laevis]
MYLEHQPPCLHCKPHEYIKMVQHMIERCLLLHMSRDDCVMALAKHARIEPVITLTVWRELLKENKEFFRAYFHTLYLQDLPEMDMLREGMQQPLADSTSLSYWLSWKVLLCLIIVVAPMILALFIIWKYEGEGEKQLNSDARETPQDVGFVLYDENIWRPCLREIHPFWLLGFQVIALRLALATFTVKVVGSRTTIFYYYSRLLMFFQIISCLALSSITVDLEMWSIHSNFKLYFLMGVDGWTFTLITFYFGFGSLLSIYGCYQYDIISNYDSNVQHVGIAAEQGYCMPLTYGKSANVLRKASNPQEKYYVSQAAGVTSYLFQVIFQINGGAVMLTDCIHWTIIFPFLTIKDYNLNFMTMNVHTLNAILLLGGTALNSLRFPWFRIFYFILWTDAYVIFQLVVQASDLIW